MLSHVSSSWCRLLQGAILHVNPAFFRVTSHCLTTAEGLSLEELLGGVSAEDGKAGWEGRLRDRAAAKLSPPPQDTPAAAAREEEEGSPVVCRQHVRRASGGLCWSVWMMGLLPRERAFVAMLEELEEEEEEPDEAPTQPPGLGEQRRQEEEEPHQASSSEGRGAEEGKQQQQQLEEAPPHEDGGDDDNPEQG